MTSKTYETSELKLAALLLSEIPESNFKIKSQGNTIKKIIQIIYSNQYEGELNTLLREYIERRSRVDVYKYNRSLNLLRDKLKENQ